MTIKAKDFIEMNFTGKLKEDGMIFDTTLPEVAEKVGLQGQFKPMIVCVGQGHLIKGLDEWLIGKEKGKYENIEISSDKAYGKKDAKLIRMVPTQQFTKHGIKPERGLQVNIDNMMATIRTVTGGRTVVDFNHPLSGKDLIYDIEIVNIVEDKKEQIQSLLKLLINLEAKQIDIKEGKAEITIHIEVPQPVLDKLKETIKDLVGVDAEFKIKQETNKEEKTEKTEEKQGQQDNKV